MSLVDNNWRDQGPSTDGLRKSVANLLEREQVQVRKRIDTMRAIEVLVRAAIVDAPKPATKIALAELGAKVMRLVGDL